MDYAGQGPRTDDLASLRAPAISSPAASFPSTAAADFAAAKNFRAFFECGSTGLRPRRCLLGDGPCRRRRRSPSAPLWPNIPFFACAGVEKILGALRPLAASRSLSIGCPWRNRRDSPPLLAANQPQHREGDFPETAKEQNSSTTRRIGQ